ncbi:MAG: aldo/keto reductase [bacterium]|nr:aldo/keto reductase [bacterium]
MSIPEKKLKNGFSLPEFGIGTWGMGGKGHRNYLNDDKVDVAAIRAAIELGVTCIDTAEMYAGGHAEELVGRAIQGFDRSSLRIITKVFVNHLSYDDTLSACKASLKRVGTEYFDMYLLHGYVADVPLTETMRAMDTLKAEGLIRNIGVANFGADHLAEAQALTENRIVYDQVHYNLEFREPERKGLLEYCQANDVLLAAWRPVQKGALLENPPGIVLEMCKKYQKTPAQIAINWLISQDNVITLAKSSSVEHLKDNLGAVGWRMEPEDIERLRSEYPDQRDVSDAVPLG